MVELHPWLHHERGDPRPHVFEPGCGESRLMRLDGSTCVLGRGRREPCQRLVGAAGDRYLGADDVDRGLDAQAVRGLFGHPQQPCRAIGHNLVGQDLRVVGAPHAAIEVDLAVAGFDVGRDERVGVGHSHRCRLVLPTVGAQMVTAEDHAVAVESLLVGDVVHQVAEVGGPHTGIAAELVDLVRRRLDEHETVVRGGLHDGCGHHGGMRRAHRVHADRIAGLVLRDRFANPV